MFITYYDNEQHLYNEKCKNNLQRVPIPTSTSISTRTLVMIELKFYKNYIYNISIYETKCNKF